MIARSRPAPEDKEMPLCSNLKYLGYLVSSQGVSVDPKKVDAILNFPVPAELKSLKSFPWTCVILSMVCSPILKTSLPTVALTKKDTPFVWGVECRVAFEKLKKLLTETAVLAFPDFEKKFTIETDASKMGSGAVHSQEQSNGLQRPIAFASRTLQPHEKNYGVTEMEALGVVWAIKHFCPYIYGQHCTVITDHQALKSLLNTPQTSGKLARWGMAIQELDLTIEYRQSWKNQKADAPSRYPTLKSCEKSKYTMVDGSLYHVAPDGTPRLIPPTCTRKSLWEQSHAGPCGGHLKKDIWRIVLALLVT